jgi:hypothetical protein
VISGLTSGATYTFRVRAKNKWGLGPYSPEVQIQASKGPDDIATAVVTANAGLKVSITWSEPNINGTPISAYTVEIQKKDSSFVTELVYCNAAQDPILTSRSCEIPLTVLRATPFLLEYGDVVFARVSSTNAIASSLGYSPVNTGGAIIMTEPVTMAAPTRGASTLPS